MEWATVLPGVPGRKLPVEMRNILTATKDLSGYVIENIAFTWMSDSWDEVN